MKTGLAAASFALLTCGYLVAFAVLESRRDLGEVDRFLGSLPLVLALTATGWLARFARWHWLLRRAGHRLPVAPSFLAYLSGFAFTATPGKLGELVRVRYFVVQGVPAWKVFSAFLFERSSDLVAVLLIAMLAIQDRDSFVLAAGFVLTVVSGLLLLALRPSLVTAIQTRMQRAGMRRSARALRFLRDGLAGCRQWLRPLDLAVSAALAFLAWGATSAALVHLAHEMGIALAWFPGLGVYPLAMLVGAASMLPGGVGSTEATIVAMLATWGVPWQTGAVIALGARLATLWFAMAAGLLALGCLEYARLRQAPPQARSTE